MASSGTQKYRLRGKVKWAKVLGPPRLNYQEDGREWTIDLITDKNSQAELKKMGLGERIRDNDGDKVITFRQKEKRLDGTLNEPVSVKDILGREWPQDKLIGNGSVCDISFAVRDYGKGKKAGVYIQGIRVLDLVPYEKEVFEPLSEDDEFFAKAVEAEKVAEEHEVITDDDSDGEVEDTELDDEIPF